MNAHEKSVIRIYTLSGIVPTTALSKHSLSDLSLFPRSVGWLTFSALPVGLSIDATTGIISGISVFGDPGVVVTATNGCGTAQSNVFVIAP